VTVVNDMPRAGAYWRPCLMLTIHELPVPTLDANEILIAVHTAGVGSWDGDMRASWWPQGKPSFPLDGRSGVREFEALNEAIEQGNVKVPIAAKAPLDQAARAHERLAAGHVLGEIVLRVRPD